MNVDVSPDGRRIVFDLLGDLYTMPIGGTGTAPATRITSGPAFDMQPRFSPDGKRIAFTSDRDGLWNIWTMNADGQEPEAGLEGAALVRQQPDVGARRQLHLRAPALRRRSDRSAPARSGCSTPAAIDGLQVTEKNGLQKDAGEPAISPDGRYLYYSKDVTPGQNFEYNKDPYGTIYAIIRRDLNTGTRAHAVSRPGRIHHAARLARRQVARLHPPRPPRQPALRARPRDRPRPAGLRSASTRTCRKRGPSTASTRSTRGRPTARASSSGARARSGASTSRAAQGSQIPFTARVEQTLNEALRFEQKVHSPEFPVEACATSRSSPDGKRVAYGALGHIYVEGAARRRAEARRPTTPRIEFAPRSRPDGQSIVYATWSDAEHGPRPRRRAPTAGRRATSSRAPGHYAEPSFSPDGKSIVYREAGSRRHPRHHAHADRPRHLRRPGRRLGGAAARARRRSRPEFDRDRPRIFLRDSRAGRAVLVSVGSAIRFAALGRRRDRPLPVRQRHADRAVARRQVGRVRRALARVRRAVPAHGPPVDLESDDGRATRWRRSRATPDSTCTGPATAGACTGRSARSSSRATSARTFTFLERRRRTKPADARSEGRRHRLHRRRATCRPARSRWSARASSPWPGQPAEHDVIENGTMVVQGNRIAAVGRSASRFPPARSASTPRGKTIMPGHHRRARAPRRRRRRHPRAGQLAAAGQPRVRRHDLARSVQRHRDRVHERRRWSRTGAKLGPRLFSTGTILYGAETPFKAIVTTYDDALSHLRRMKAVGAFCVKSYNQQRRDARQMIIKAARELEMVVVPEGGSLLYYNQTMMLDGHTAVEHSLPVPKLYKDVVTLFAQEQDRLHADADRRLRRAERRVLLVPARRTSGRTSGC